MTSNEPKNEQIKLTTETITGQDLRKKIFKNGKPDPKFVPLDERDPYSGELIGTGVFLREHPQHKILLTPF